MTEEQYANVLKRYLPKDAVPKVVELLYKEPIELKISKDRQSKHGDYRPPFNGSGHKISVNGSLNPYGFLITLIHEYAHYKVQCKFGNKVNPHGVEWKNQFKLEFHPFLTKSIFPDDILLPLVKHMKNPAASSSRDVVLQKALKQYDAKPSTLLDDLEEGAVFILNKKRIFQKGEKLRKRYKCIELQSKRTYLISGLAEVELVRQ
tara:strand:- start:1084 stop:1698 length:615 start_codon:yes stop_codon:yes gene_type:complete